MDLNKGIYQDKDLANNAPTDFSVGVAGYPEKHAEAPNITTDIRHLKEKIDAGGEYIVTQMFFDNRHYFEFVSQCREAGITVPIIPGLKPISTVSQLSTLPRTFNISIPEDLQRELEKCKDNRGARQAGIEWCLAQSKELMKANVPALHYFTMGKSDNIREIVKEIF
jgi:methylenetetrahydrofolate reductase (NADPH)